MLDDAVAEVQVATGTLLVLFVEQVVVVHVFDEVAVAAVQLETGSG